MLGVIRVGDLVEKASVAGSAKSSLGLTIIDLDATQSERLLYLKNASLNLPEGFRLTRTISVAGRSWQITAYPLPGAFPVPHWGSWAVLVAGLLLTGLLALYLRNSLERHSAIEQMVAERTGALRESEDRFRRLVDLSPDAILVGRKNLIVAETRRRWSFLGLSHQAI